MKTSQFDPAECGALSVLTSVLQIYFGKPVTFTKLWMRSAVTHSADRSIEVSGMVRYTESAKSSSAASFDAILSLCSPVESEWIAHAGAQAIVVAGYPVQFCRISGAYDLVRTFRLRTKEGNLVVGSNFHDIVIVSP